MAKKVFTGLKCAALGLTGLITLGATNAMSHEVDSKFAMTVIRDAAHGAKIVAGNYGGAIERLADGRYRSSEKFFAANNLCVAYTMTSRFDAAEESCSTAVEMIQRDRLTDESSIAARYHAIALSNRGVLRAMSGEGEMAREDFEAARALRAGMALPTRNLGYLAERNARASLN